MKLYPIKTTGKTGQKFKARKASAVTQPVIVGWNDEEEAHDSDHGKLNEEVVPLVQPSKWRQIVRNFADFWTGGDNQL